MSDGTSGHLSEEVRLFRSLLRALSDPLKLTLILMGLMLSLGGCLEARRATLEPTHVPDQPDNDRDQVSELADPYPSVEPGPTALRRLTRAQIERALRDVFGETLVVPKLADPDLEQGGLLSVGASAIALSARGVSSLEEASFMIAQQVVTEPVLRSQLLECELETRVEDVNREGSCAQRTLSRVGEALWRQPLNDEERLRVHAVATRAAETLEQVDEGLVFGLATLLQSPHFIYRAELPSDRETDQFEGLVTTFDAYGLATRLSFFLWNTAPDAELIDSAESGELLTREGLTAQTERMLASPKLRDGLTQLFTEQLRLHLLRGLRKSAEHFEHYKPELMEDAAHETLELLLYIALDEHRDFRDVVTSRETFLSPRLAALYGVPAPTIEGFRRVELPLEARRMGILTHASVLSVNAHSTTSSATLRGAFVRTALLCQEIPPPPPDVDTSVPEPSGEALTLRERVAEHLQNPTCAGCHELLDPIGLGLENYDAIGRWRDLDHGGVIDASGELDGIRFQEPEGLAEAIKEHPAFTSCLVRTLARYAIGRVETIDERALLSELTARFEGEQYRFKSLLLELILSPLFLNAGAPQ